MDSKEYFQLLQKPFDWDLQPDEKALAASMAKEFGGRIILNSWHEFQKDHPLGTFQEFEVWFKDMLKEAAKKAGPEQASLDFGDPFASVYSKIRRPAARTPLIAAALLFLARPGIEGNAMPIPTFVPVPAVEVQRTDPYELFPIRYRETIRRVNGDAGIPAEILFRLIDRESGWNERIIGGPNADGSRDLGLMQLNETWIKYFAAVFFSGPAGEFDPFNPEHSLEVGMRYLRRLFDVTGSWLEAVQAYNCGLSRVREGSIPEATKRYSRHVVDSGNR